MNAESLERVHHPYSPSSLPSREACPKYKNHNSTNAAAIAGTIQHNLVETRIDDGTLTDAQVDAVTQCILFGEERAANYPGGQIIQEVYLPIDDEVIVVDTTSVEKFDIISEDGQVSPGFRGLQKRVVFDGTTAGYLDFAIISADGLDAEIVDWKYGKNLVTAARDNLQGIAYMLGLKKLYPSILRCRVTFLQPHIDEMSEHSFDLSNTDELYLRIRTVVGRSIEAAKNPDDYSTARPNIGTCLFCALVGKCPKVVELVVKLGHKYKPLQIPNNVSPTTISDPVDVDMGIRLADVVKGWAESFRRQATEKTIENTDFIPEGFILVSTTKREIKDMAGFAKTAKEFLPDELHKEVDALFKIPITPVEDLISTAAPRGQKEKRVEEFAARVIDKGFVELGTPFAFLRQSQKGDKEAKVATK